MRLEILTTRQFIALLNSTTTHLQFNIRPRENFDVPVFKNPRTLMAFVLFLVPPLPHVSELKSANHLNYGSYLLRARGGVQ